MLRLVARAPATRFNARGMLVARTDISADSSDDVVLQEKGNSGIILLNRPRALNALNLSMVQKIYPRLKEWESTKDLIIIKGSGDKAFCAGGDVKSIVLSLAQPGGDQLGKDFFRQEYTLNHLIGTYKTPYVSILHGITMGGGVGLSVHGKYRIATEKTMFAMPETAIGLFPDVGGTYFLPKLKGKLGLYLGLTGHRLKGADVLLAGIATHFVPSEKLEELTQDLISNSNNIDSILQQYDSSSVTQEFCLSPHMNLINTCFAAPSVEDIIERLEESSSEWAKNVANVLCKMSPTALKVTKKAIDESENKNLAECLTIEYRLACASLKKNSDFAEGVRALLIDRDQNAVWNPKSLTEVSDELINKRFAPLSDQNELNL